MIDFEKMSEQEKLKLRIAGNLKSAITILEEDGPDRIGSVCWRVADAGFMLRELIDLLGEKDIYGFDHPTGMKATLPTKQP